MIRRRRRREEEGCSKRRTKMKIGMCEAEQQGCVVSKVIGFCFRFFVVALKTCCWCLTSSYGVRGCGCECSSSQSLSVCLSPTSSSYPVAGCSLLVKDHPSTHPPTHPPPSLLLYVACVWRRLPHASFPPTTKRRRRRFVFFLPFAAAAEQAWQSRQGTHSQTVNAVGSLRSPRAYRSFPSVLSHL